MSEHAISALVRKRAALLGEIERTKEHLSVLQQSIAHVDGALAVFGYEFAAEIKPTYRRQRGYFDQGELSQFILGRLRAEGPQSVVQLRDAAMANKDIRPGNPLVTRSIHRKVAKALARQEERGTVTTGDGKMWGLS